MQKEGEYIFMLYLDKDENGNEITIRSVVRIDCVGEFGEWIKESLVKKLRGAVMVNGVPLPTGGYIEKYSININ